jgi:hypothetical protein
MHLSLIGLAVARHEIGYRLFVANVEGLIILMNEFTGDVALTYFR